VLRPRIEAAGGDASLVRFVKGEVVFPSGKAAFADLAGVWAPVQNVYELYDDPQAVANGYIQECKTATGVPFQLVAAPVQYDEQSAVPQRAPEFNEHGDAILTDLGIDWDTIVDLKVRGVVG